MKLSLLFPVRIFFLLPVFVFVLVNVLQPTNSWARKKEVYDIIYLLTNDLERVLDYKEELSSVFDEKIQRKLKVVIMRY